MSDIVTQRERIREAFARYPGDDTKYHARLDEFDAWFEELSRVTFDSGIAYAVHEGIESWDLEDD